MKKFIISIFKFIFFIILFYIGFIILWGDLSPLKKNLNYKIGPGGHTYTRLKEVKNTKDVDLLFLGSSHTYRGFDTRIFNELGYKSFNLGTNSQTPIQTEFLLNRYLDSLNPKIIVFEVCPFVFSLDGVESTLEIISNDYINFETIKMALKQNHLKIYNTLIYGLYRETLYDDKNNYSESRERNNDTYIDGGFVEITHKPYRRHQFEQQKWKYNKDQFVSFKNIVDLIDRKKIKLVLIQAPVTSDLYNSYQNNNEFDLEMRKYGVYYNHNEMLQLNDTMHFFDFHHLNKNGIKIFNASLLDLLEKTVN